MKSTIIHFQATGEINITETALSTARALTGGRGAFNVEDVRLALEAQGVSLTKAQLAKPLRRNLTFRGAGWFAYAGQKSF